MAKKCAICTKKPLKGNLVSHSNNKTRRRSLPNLKSVRALVEGTIKRIRVCTRCIRTGLVTKAV